MRLPWLLFGAGILWLAPPSAAQTASVKVEVEGLTGELEQNVRSLMSLVAAANGKDTLSTLRIRRLYGQAPEQIELALQPFGYYRPVISSELTTGTTYVARFIIDAGPQVLVTSTDLRATGLGQEDSLIQVAIADFPLAPGDPLLHQEYTAGKRAIIQAAFNRGYLDASFDTAQIQIDRDQYESAIVLDLSTGPQYRFGPVIMQQDLVDSEVLQGYITIIQGEPFDPRELRDIQVSMAGTSYFSQVDVRALPDSAQGLEIPVEIVVKARRAQHFNIGVGYGTNTFFRVTLNADFRRLNSKGHFANLSLRVSSIERSMSARYSIPAAYPRTRLLTLTMGLALLDPVSYNTNKAIVGADLSKVVGNWRETMSLSYSYEDYVIGGADSGISNLLIASTNFTRVVADNKIFATKGTQAGFMVRGAINGVLSNASFLEIRLPAKSIFPLLGAGRLITRAELGYIFTDQFFDLPPTARFFTGGDRSVRGYEYQSLGPVDPAGNITGGDVLFVASAELNYFFYGNFGASVFYDAGNALSGLNNISLAQGTGFGLRWRSPIGPIGVDLAWAITEEGDPRRVHITLGPDF
jgi:translocation and assembly module TamA